MTRVCAILVLLFLGSSVLFAQDSRLKIKDLVDREFVLDNDWAGESVTLVKRGTKQIAVRKVFGYGVPVAGFYEYEVDFISDYQIRFSKIIGPEASLQAAVDADSTLPQEEFQISIEEDVSIFLNGLKLKIEERTSPH